MAMVEDLVLRSERFELTHARTQDIHNSLDYNSYSAFRFEPLTSCHGCLMKSADHAVTRTKISVCQSKQKFIGGH